MAMRIFVGEKRGADIVRSIDQFNVFAPPQPFANTVEILGEGCAVALAHIGEHAEQMVRAQPDRHGVKTRDYWRVRRWLAFTVNAASADFRMPPRMNGVTPKANAFSPPMSEAR